MKFASTILRDITKPFPNIRARVIFQLMLGSVFSYLIQFFFYEISWTSFLKTLVLYVANDYVFTIGHTQIFTFLDLKYDWLKDTTRRFIYGVIYHTVFSAVAFLLVQLVTLNLLFDMSGREVMIWFADTWIIPVGLSAVIIVFTTTIGFFGKWKKSLVEEEQIKTEMMAYKFDALKGQINPTFLFDNFDELKRLIMTDQKVAVNVIQKMSQLYRAVLETKDMELVSLEKELHQVSLFIDLLDLRYGDRLKVLQDIKEDEQDRIVPGAIQHVLQLMLAEDHISDDMLTLSINRSNDYLVISSLNSNADINLEEIRNIQQRYEFFTDLKVKTESNEKGVLCTIPILKEEI